MLFFRGDREFPTSRRIRQNSYSRPLSAINDLFDSRDFLFHENQDEVLFFYLELNCIRGVVKVGQWVQLQPLIFRNLTGNLHPSIEIPNDAPVYELSCYQGSVRASAGNLQWVLDTCSQCCENFKSNWKKFQ